MSVVDDYLASVTKPQRDELQRIRGIVHRVAPGAQEVITYGMPGFKYQGKYFLSFAAFKDHLSLFPGAQAVAMFQDQLTGYKLSKGTIQFTLDHRLSETFVEAIVRFRVAAIDTIYRKH